MRKFATESGKSKGQFYTPAEVSRILAKIIGISEETDPNATIYDPACGSGSLLIRALDESPIELAGYGQEKDTTTAGLAVMNTVLHGKATATIKSGNTFSDPQYFEENSDETILRRFDYIVANPPFSIKNWTDGLKEYGRFEGYDGKPPEKNGDYAWLLHILKSLKNTGKAAVIFPLGVLFRGNAEGEIRKKIIDKGLIKGIIGLPENLFYGTGIPACILVIDKEDAHKRTGIFMIDASHDFQKDGNKNRLRERDIYKIVTTFNNQIVNDSKYARFVSNEEIKQKNDYNLNLSRYIDSGDKGDLHSIEAHLKGGIPAEDIDSLNVYWDTFKDLKEKLFSVLRNRFYNLNVKKEEIRPTIYEDKQFSEYADRIKTAFINWRASVDNKLRNINQHIDTKELIVFLAEGILQEFKNIKMIDKYDVYQVLLAYWQEIMSDDVYLLIHDGFKAGRDISYEYVTKEKKKGDETIIVVTDKIKSWEGKLIPKKILINKYFAKEQQAIDDADIILTNIKTQIEEMIEEADETIISEIQNEKGSINMKAMKARIDEIRNYIKSDEIRALEEFLQVLPTSKTERDAYVMLHPLCKKAYNKSGNINVTSIKTRINEIRTSAPVPEKYTEEYEILVNLEKLINENYEKNKILRELKLALEESVKAKYAELTEEEIKDLIINKKWYTSIFDGIEYLYTAISSNLTTRITTLADRYEETLPLINNNATKFEEKVSPHLDAFILGKDRLPGFNEEWVEMTLEEVGELTSSGVDKKIFPDEIPITLLNFTNVYHQTTIFRKDLNHVVTASAEKIKACSIKKGDVLLTPTSETPEDIAYSAVAVEDMPDVVYSYHVIRLRPHEGFNGEFINYALGTKHFRNQAMSYAEGSGIRYVIPLKKFKEMTIKMPKDPEEQQAIVSYLGDMDKEIEILEKKLEKYKKIKLGMMTELLTAKDVEKG